MKQFKNQLAEAENFILQTNQLNNNVYNAYRNYVGVLNKRVKWWQLLLIAFILLFLVDFPVFKILFVPLMFALNILNPNMGIAMIFLIIYSVAFVFIVYRFLIYPIYMKNLKDKVTRYNHSIAAFDQWTSQSGRYLGFLPERLQTITLINYMQEMGDYQIGSTQKEIFQLAIEKYEHDRLYEINVRQLNEMKKHTALLEDIAETNRQILRNTELILMGMIYIGRKMHQINENLITMNKTLNAINNNIESINYDTIKTYNNTTFVRSL